MHTKSAVIDVRPMAKPQDGVPAEWACPVCGGYSLQCPCDYDTEVWEFLGRVHIVHTPEAELVYAEEITSVSS